MDKIKDKADNVLHKNKGNNDNSYGSNDNSYGSNDNNNNNY